MKICEKENKYFERYNFVSVMFSCDPTPLTAGHYQDQTSQVTYIHPFHEE